MSDLCRIQAKELIFWAQYFKIKGVYEIKIYWGDKELEKLSRRIFFASDSCPLAQTPHNRSLNLQQDSSARSGRRNNRGKPPSMILPKDDEEEVEFGQDRYSGGDTSRSRLTKDAPHCVTCACLSSKMSCSYQQMTTCFDRYHHYYSNPRTYN